MKSKKTRWLLGVILLLLAACTTTGGNPITENNAVIPTATATAVSPTATPVTSQTITHNGISLTYDPTLLDEIHIQDIPATSNEGMFDQPSPAHTWIGFVPDGIQRDPRNHWMLSHEPQIIVYNLTDFGSFSPGDQYAQERISAWQALAAERPSTISEQIPVIVPLNAGQVIRAQVKWFDFGNGMGLRFVTQYDQSAQPINNEGLVYIFQGMTTDGLHGITAVFPLDAVGLPDSPVISEPDYTAFIENFAAEMTAVTDLLNTAPSEDFTPSLSQLDTMMQSITVEPTDTDFVVSVLAPIHGNVLVDTNLYTSPTGTGTNGQLSLGDAVVVNAQSEDDRRYRILCADGSTSNCWVDADTLQISTIAEEPIFFTGDFPQVNDAVQVTAVTNNPIYHGPGATQQKIGELLVGEQVEIFGVDETGQWLAITCPRNIGLACWVTADTAVNEPTGFFAGDGWQDISSEYITFRVPGPWQPTVVTPGMGSVLDEWYLGIPNVDSDQTIAFFSSTFADLKPSDLVSEDSILIGGQPGLKWIRGGESYTSYDYYTAGTEGTQELGAGSFGLHVTVDEADPELEAILDMVAMSIIFNK